MKILTLKHGHEVILDDEDYERVKDFSWHIDTNGYVQGRVGPKGSKKRARLHRYIMDAKKGDTLDHANRDRLDNRKENLRFVTQSQNPMNKRKQKTARGGKPTSSRYKGVSKKSNGKFQAYCQRKQLGIFKNELEAAKAYNTAAKKAFGEYAALNEIEAP